MACDGSSNPDFMSMDVFMREIVQEVLIFLFIAVISHRKVENLLIFLVTKK